jgi:hypothetical protein
MNLDESESLYVTLLILTYHDTTQHNIPRAAVVELERFLKLDVFQGTLPIT